MIDDVEDGVLEHHLRGGGLVEPRFRVLGMLDVLDAQNRVRVPHLLGRDRFAEDLDQGLGVGLVNDAARPVGEVAVEKDLAVRLQHEDIFQRGVIGIGLAVVVAVGGGAHVAAFAREPGPAALGRGDHRVIKAERVEHAVIAVEPAHAAVLADVERDRAGVAKPVDHRHHGRPRGAGERRAGEREPGVIVVVGGADQQRRFVHAELLADVARRPRAAVDGAHVEQAGRLAAQHAERLRRFLERGADQRGGEGGMIPGAEPAVDPADVEAAFPHVVAQRVDRQRRVLVGVLDRREALFFIVEQQARAVAGHLDERDAGVVGAGRRDTGEIDCLPTRDLVTDLGNTGARGGASGTLDIAAATGAVDEAQRKLVSQRAKPWMAWSNSHLKLRPRRSHFNGLME